MNKKTKRIFQSLTSLNILVASIFASSQCTTIHSSNEQQNSEDIHTYLSQNIDNWDGDIKIVYRNFNPLFDFTKQKEFLYDLTDRYNKIKNSYPELKKYPDVIIDFQPQELWSTIQGLNEGNIDTDFSTVPYYSIIKSVDANEFYAQITAQTKTLKFAWSGDDNLTYINGLNEDPLRKIADKINKEYSSIIINNHQLEFADWDINRDKEVLQFDGSKFNRFYDQNHSTTYIYHGAILISGNDQQLNSIIKAWNDKNWEQFKSYGIVYESHESGGDYKYQVAILAKHFNKTIAQINQELSPTKGDKINVLPGCNPAIQLGKETTRLNNKNYNRSFNITFDAEGSLNWTLPGQDAHYFSPSGKDAKVRTLIITNPAPYDLMLARAGMPKVQVLLMREALKSLKFEENTYGIYTGYNKFVDLSQETFNNFVKLQKFAEGKISLKANEINIPKDENE